MRNLRDLTQNFHSFFSFPLLLLFLLSGCSTQKLAVRVTSGLLVNGMAAINEESDLILAEQAIASDLKLLEALLRSDPGNKKLLLMAAEGYTGYALGFVEDQSPKRASRFYLRARDFAMTVLKKNKSFAAARAGDMAKFSAALTSFKKKDVPALFWAANAWGSYINLNKTEVNALADLARVEALMKRALQLDETFYYGGPHLFLGSILASRPAMLGGNPAKAKEHFTACFRISKNKYLLAKYLYAKTYAVQIQDRELFKNVLQEIINAPENLLPEKRLTNEIAKKKAKALLEQEEDLFF